MNLRYLTLLVLFAAVLACADAPDPLERDGAKLEDSSADLAGALSCGRKQDTVRPQLCKLFPDGRLQNTALRRYTAFQQLLQQGRVDEARQAMFDLVAYIADNFAVLEDPNGRRKPPTKSEAVLQVTNDLHAMAGTEPPQTETVTPTETETVPLQEPDGTTAGAVVFPEGALEQPVELISTRVADDTPLQTEGLQTFPPFYHFQTVPEVTFAEPVIVWLCVEADEPALSRLVLAKQDDDGTFTTLPRPPTGAEPPPDLICADPAPSASAAALAGGKGGAAGPQPELSGVRKIIGGTVSSFSYVFAVDPGGVSLTDLDSLSPSSRSAAYGISDAGRVVGASSDGSDEEELASLWSDGEMVSLGTLPFRSSSRANGINNLGQVVGQSGESTAFVWEQSEGMTELPNLIPDGAEGGYGPFTVAHAINEGSHMVGASSFATGYRAVLWEIGQEQPLNLGTLEGDEFSEAFAINESGHVVGKSAPFAGAPTGRAFMWKPGEGMTSLPSPAGYYDVSAQAINDNGQIVGTGFSDTGARALLWTGGVVQVLGTLEGYLHSSGSGIDNAGRVVGTSSSESTFNAFLWENGVMTDLGTVAGPGGFAEARAINNLKQVVGRSSAEGNAHATMWTLP